MIQATAVCDTRFISGQILRISQIRARMVTLDEIIPKNDKIAFIKIDIEGGEFHTIKGGTETIRHCKLGIVFEAIGRSTAQYGLKSDDVYSSVTESIGYDFSTLER